MDTLQAIILGLVQGLTEYLPVSSSGHLAIGAHFFGIDGEENLMFTIMVHVATVLSTLVILHSEIWWIVKGVFGHSPLMGLNGAQRYALAIVVSMIPVGIVGLCFKDMVEEIFGSGLTIVAICLLLTSALLAFSSYAPVRPKQDISLWDAFIIGVAQAAAVMPGLSRSGSTIATGQLLGINKANLAQFSFLMVIPPILGEALLDMLKVFKTGGVEEAMGGLGVMPLLCGFVAAFASGCLACRWMIALVRRGKLIWFAAYCALVAVALLVF